MMSENIDIVLEIKARLADRYTAAELCDLLDIDVEDIIDIYWDKILEHNERYGSNSLEFNFLNE